MSFRTFWILLVAIVAGTMAVLAVNRLLVPNYQTAHDVFVVGAKRDILPFEVTTMEMIEPKVISKLNYREGEHFLWPSDLSSDRNETAESLWDKICGRTVIAAISRGQLVTESSLADKKAGQGLADLIPRHQRAVAIDVSKTDAAVAGYFIRPNTWVDILSTTQRGTTPGAGPGAETTMILEGVRVLAVDQRPLNSRSDGTSGDPRLRSVTVLLDATDVETLERYKAIGTLSLVSRNSKDFEPDADEQPADQE